MSGRRIAQKVESRQKWIDESYHLLNNLLFRPYAHVFPSFSYSYREWVWALDTVLTRAEVFDETLRAHHGLAIVPFMDFFDHHPQACNASSPFHTVVDHVHYQGQTYLSLRFGSDDQLKPDGTVIYRCYKNPLSDEETFLRYGFVLDPHANAPNTYNYLPISFELAMPHEFHHKIQEEIGFVDRRQTIMLSKLQKSIDKSFLDAFRFDALTPSEYDSGAYLTLKKSDVEVERDEAKSGERESQIETVVSIRNEYLALKELEEALESVEKTISKSSLADDELTLIRFEQKAHLRTNQLKILRLVIGQKKIIEWYIHLARDRWHSLLRHRERFEIAHNSLL